MAFVVALAFSLFALSGDQTHDAIPASWHALSSEHEAYRFWIERRGHVQVACLRAPYGRGVEVVPAMFPPNGGHAAVPLVELLQTLKQREQVRVIGAINGGFFDPRSGLAIGFLMRDGEMQFFNMPPGFKRSMVGFTANQALIATPDVMPKGFLLVKKPGGESRLPIHHVNIPGGRDALTLWTRAYGDTVLARTGGVYIEATQLPGGRYRVERVCPERRVQPIPRQGLLIALHGASAGVLSSLPQGALFRLSWSLPEEWENLGVTHGLLAGPRLVADGRVYLTDQVERLSRIKGRDRVGLGVTAKGSVLLVWMRHTNPGSVLTYKDMAEQFIALGARDAIAMDGGSSRAMMADVALGTPRFITMGRPIPNALVIVVHEKGSTVRGWCAIHPWEGPGN